MFGQEAKATELLGPVGVTFDRPSCLNNMPPTERAGAITNALGEVGGSASENASRSAASPVLVAVSHFRKKENKLPGDLEGLGLARPSFVQTPNKAGLSYNICIFK